MKFLLLDLELNYVSLTVKTNVRMGTIMLDYLLRRYTIKLTHIKFACETELGFYMLRIPGGLSAWCLQDKTKRNNPTGFKL